MAARKATWLLSISVLCWCSVGVLGNEDVLSEEELQLVFGRRETVPKYNLVVPRVSRGGWHPKRSARSAPEAPTLKFDALGRSFNFKLQRNTELISPEFVFMQRNGDEADIMELDERNYEMYYQGVDDTGDSNIAVELSNNIRGVITSASDQYVIQALPEAVTRRRRSIEPEGERDDALPTHIVYRRESHDEECPSESHSRRRRSFISDTDEISRMKAQQEETRAALGSREGRRSYYDSFEHVVDEQLRSEWHRDNRYGPEGHEDNRARGFHGEDLYIETAVFVDKDLYRHMQDNFPRDTEDQVLKVVLAMVNAVQLLYNDDTLGHRIKFVLKRLEILYKDPTDLHRPYDIDNLLTNFCSWQRKENPPRDSDPLHWDHALILTGLDVFTINSKGRVNSQVVGLAPVAGMCTASSSCTANEGRHFESVYVVAHEIGHNLGMRHDGLQAGNNCDPGRYIMSPTLGSGKITWSSCSRRYLDDFLRTAQAECLRDAARPLSQPLNHEQYSPPGQRFSADQQCMLKHGVGSTHATSQPLADICQDLHCHRDPYTWTSHPALEGTTCGHRKWCRRGRCVDDAQAPTLPLSSGHSPSSSSLTSSSSTSSASALLPTGVGVGNTGVRGEWGPWSACNSECLYSVDGVLSSGSTGLSLSERRCRTCHGEYRYRVCSAVQKCSAGRRKTVQDFADDTCRDSARNSAFLTGLAARVPARGPSQCEVQCRTGGQGERSSGKAFPDGTVCASPSSLPSFCVAGVCTEFRCEADALYGADPLTCRPDMGVPDPHRPLGPSHPTTRRTTTPPRQTTPQPPAGYGETGVWGPWIPASTCRASCVSSAKGIQLVSRDCRSHRCTGINRNIQICNPSNSGCERIQSTFEYASEVCRRYMSEVDQLSGIGMQLSSTKDDPDRACTVACQDARLNYRFYRVNGGDGWFPFGTDCARGTAGRSAYCLNGKCLDFSNEGTPLRNTIFTEYEHQRSLDMEPIERAYPLEVNPYHEDFRQPFYQESAPQQTYQWQTQHVQEPYRPRQSTWFGGRRKRDVTSSSHPISSTISDQLLMSLVDELNSTLMSKETSSKVTPDSIDFQNPLFVGEQVTENNTFTLNPNSFELKPFNPSNLTSEGGVDEEGQFDALQEFRWRLLVSPCSVSCGKGVEEVLLLCVQRERDDLPVADRRCSHLSPPASGGFRPCWREEPCPRRPPDEDLSSSPVGRWVLGLLEGIVDTRGL
ncbi:A disintegrin and metalloproteinase with thrombospondin motifs adt-1-like isoform X1 [Penaeus chinensis]|uniref:A disintegrin and metalloproteinase with thrombospondin motifs adt-1-like isoform X1 n=1 Tax=Penaeus chinensis TaxID=139456 RepID=UPI001FB77318|nr:A disintegrin and metalloproteinase with thrombospondin motifs adt-1-like isoform X1 [Penaeus chinensis]